MVIAVVALLALVDGLWRRGRPVRRDTPGRRRFTVPTTAAEQRRGARLDLELELDDHHHEQRGCGQRPRQHLAGVDEPGCGRHDPGDKHVSVGRRGHRRWHHGHRRRHGRHRRRDRRDRSGGSGSGGTGGAGLGSAFCQQNPGAC